MSQFDQRPLSADRQHPRYAIGTEVNLRSRAGAIAHGRTTNLSRGGLCADVDAEPERGQPIEVSIALVFNADGVSEPLALPARVVWCTGLGDRFQVGLSFLAMSKEQAAFLDVFIRFLEEHPEELSDEKSASRSLPFDLSR